MRRAMSIEASEGAGSRTPKLLDQVRVSIRTKHYSRRTEKAYTGWTVSRIEIRRIGGRPEKLAESISVSPTVLQSGPYRFFFFSSYRNEPIHVHVKRTTSSPNSGWRRFEWRTTSGSAGRN
jgi:hypothetical protein